MVKPSNLTLPMNQTWVLPQLDVCNANCHNCEKYSGALMNDEYTPYSRLSIYGCYAHLPCRLPIEVAFGIFHYLNIHFSNIRCLRFNFLLLAELILCCFFSLFSFANQLSNNALSWLYSTFNDIKVKR